MTGDPYRIIRSRHGDLTDGLDRLGSKPPDGSARCLAQVYQIVSIPTTNEKYFACHPVTVDGIEAEGVTPTLTADITQTIYVLVIGSRVPVVGDFLIPRAVNGRWVAELRGTTSIPIAQAGCLCDPTPSVLNFAGSYATIFGPPGRDPTSLGCPTSTILTAQTPPPTDPSYADPFDAPTHRTNNTVWMSPTFNYTYYVLDPSTGLMVPISTTGGIIIFWCQPGSIPSTQVEIRDVNGTATPSGPGRPYQGTATALAESGAGSGFTTLIHNCSPFLWKQSGGTSSWQGITQLSG